MNKIFTKIFVISLLAMGYGALASDSSILLKPSYLEMWENLPLELQLNTLSSNLSSEVTYTSSDENVATVSSDGNVKAVAVGECIITAKAGDVLSNEVKVKITPKVVRAENQRLILDTKGPRIDPKLLLSWPTEYGKGHVALWKNGAIGALSVTADDNLTWNFPRWEEYRQRYGISVTLFVPTRGMDKSLDLWKKMLELGHFVQSHTKMHPSKNAYQNELTSAETWMDFYVAHQEVEEYLPCKSKVVAYSWGVNYPEMTKLIYAAGRGVVGLPNQPESINYNSVNTYSLGSDADLTTQISSVFDSNFKIWNKTAYGGWTVLLYHNIGKDHDGSGLDNGLALAKKAIEDRKLWADGFENVTAYGQERDTAKLNFLSATSDKITFDITDEMDDEIFDFPLSVKICVDESWKYAFAEQGGVRRNVELLDVDGVRCAIVDAVPDRGVVSLHKVDKEYALDIDKLKKAHVKETSFGNARMQDVLSGAYEPKAGDTLVIDGVEDWRSFVKYVNDGNSCAGMTIALASSINLLKEDNVSVGATTFDKYYFSGTFDGRGNTIKYQLKGINNVGLFTTIDGATIQNLRVYCSVSGKNRVGGLVGALNGDCNIKNCFVYAKIEAEEELVGGLVGVAEKNKTLIDNCTFIGSVKGNKYVGGIIGGGSVYGVINSTVIANVLGDTNVGGIAGRMYSNSNGMVIIVCNNAIYGSVSGASIVGGLTGEIGVCNAAKAKNNLVACDVSSKDSNFGIITSSVRKGGNNPSPSSLYVKIGDKEAVGEISDGASCEAIEVEPSIIGKKNSVKGFESIKAISLASIPEQLNTATRSKDVFEYEYNQWKNTTICGVDVVSPTADFVPASSITNDNTIKIYVVDDSMKVKELVVKYGSKLPDQFKSLGKVAAEPITKSFVIYNLKMCTAIE